MSGERKKVVVEVDAKTYSAIEEYSDYTNQKEEVVINQLFKHTLEKFSINYKNLKEGYIEMANINLEISDAFTISEDEASSYIKED